MTPATVYRSHILEALQTLHSILGMLLTFMFLMLILAIINNTKWIGVEINGAKYTAMYGCTVSHAGWNGIDISHSTHTLMSRVTLDNIGWMGIQGTSAD